MKLQPHIWKKESEKLVSTSPLREFPNIFRGKKTNKTSFEPWTSFWKFWRLKIQSWPSLHTKDILRKPMSRVFPTWKHGPGESPVFSTSLGGLIRRCIICAMVSSTWRKPMGLDSKTTEMEGPLNPLHTWILGFWICEKSLGHHLGDGLSMFVSLNFSCKLNELRSNYNPLTKVESSSRMLQVSRFMAFKAAPCLQRATTTVPKHSCGGRMMECWRSNKNLHHLPKREEVCGRST